MHRRDLNALENPRSRHGRGGSGATCLLGQTRPCLDHWGRNNAPCPDHWGRNSSPQEFSAFSWFTIIIPLESLRFFQSTNQTKPKPW
jgi:hypothetical protein